LTPAEVSSVLRVSRMTIYRLIHDESLAAIRVGRSFRIPAQALRHLEGHD
jgi:excisionase family DNA binding protein